VQRTGIMIPFVPLIDLLDQPFLFS